jgi:hypothetical protein
MPQLPRKLWLQVDVKKSYVLCSNGILSIGTESFIPPFQTTHDTTKTHVLQSFEIPLEILHSKQVLSIVAAHDLKFEKLDVKTAFLHGEFEEEIYMDQPQGFIVPVKENYVCKLKRSLYCLKQSPR